MNIRRNWFFIVPAAILGIVLFTFLGGMLVKQLWNWLLPPLFGFPALTFWQALAMLALCRILFGGLGLGGRRSRRRMSHEERERFREGLHGRETPQPSL